MRRLNRLFFVVFVLFFSRAHASSNYVTVCKLEDQFGGQLFFVAMVHGMAWEHHLFPLLSKQTFINAPNGQLNYDRFFYQFAKEPPIDFDQSPPRHPVHHHSFPYAYRGGNICLCGVRTENWYFNRYRERIRELFSPTPQILEKLKADFSSIIDAPKTVGVHIRTYHPTRCPNHLFLGEEYYKTAMNHFDNDHLFVIFSDRIDWCKKHFTGFKSKMIFVDGNDHIIDLFLLSFCKNIICANSTFSWWAAYLKQDQGGRVLVPSMWSAIEYYQLHSSDVVKRRLYLPEWEVLPVTNIPPPNSELLSYSSTSVRERD